MAVVAHAVPVGSATFDLLYAYTDSGIIILADRCACMYPDLHSVVAYFPELLTHIPIHPESQIARECVQKMRGYAFYNTPGNLYIRAAR